MTWAIIALLVGLALVVAEVFIPSGGVIGFLAAGLLLLSLVLAYLHSPTTGLVFTLIICIAAPGAVMTAFHFWPRTPLGKRIFLAHPSAEEIDPTGPKQRSLQSLKGEIGRTLTPLRPAGVTEFDGRRIDTIAEGVMIEQGEPVRVIAVQGSRVVVRKLEEEEEAADAEDSFQEPSFDFPSA
jgi:membrane-bound ClpP family serine protease